MVELKSKMTESGVLYIPIAIREAFGRLVRIIPDARAAVLFPDETQYEEVLESLRLIASEIEHRIKLRPRQSGERQEVQ